MAGFGISDDLVKALIKAAGSGASKKAKKRASSIVKRVEKKDPALAGTIKKKAGKLEHQVARTRTKRADMTKTTTMAKAHSDTMRRAGKNWDGSKNEKLTKIASANKRTKARTTAENEQMAKDYAKKQAGLPPKVKSQQKMFNKADIEAARGTGKVMGKGGKPRSVSPARAAKGRSTAGAINSSIKRTNDAQKAQLSKLETKLKNATTPAQKLAARRAIRNFRGETGR